MSRRRMYLFERAYADYGARLRWFARRLLSSSGSIWTWFWEGLGATIIEGILRLAVVGSAVGMAIWYVRYENAQGRGFSFSLVLAFLVIFVYVGVLLWGWKAPVHFIARVISGASAAGVVLCLALIAILTAAAVFSIYLVLLFALTALSFVLFLPMRGIHSVWLLYRGIAYPCPYDDCAHRGKLPIHVCECGVQYKDLQPSFYGIFRHTCRHADKEVKLPTLDLLGRNNLARLCGKCERPLIHSSMGELSEWPVAIVGGVNSGKTVFLIQATRLLRDHLRAMPHGTARIDSEAQEQDFQQKMDQMNRGQVVAKTAGGVMLAFGLAIRIPKKLRCLLYLFDKPGEDFQNIRRLGQMQAIKHLKGIVLLADPFTLPALSEYAGESSHNVGASSDQFSKIADNLINGVNMMISRRAGAKYDIPLAVVLSKADAFPTDEFPFLSNLCPNNGRPAEGLSGQCRDALNKLGAGPSVRALEMNFSKVHYFASTALGRSPDLRNASPFEPEGVMEPFLWLLGLKADEPAGEKAHAASVEKNISSAVGR